MGKNLKDRLRMSYYYISKCKLPLLVVCLGQACTLKCRDCANFAPLAPKENLIYRSDHIIKDLKNILKASKYIDVLQLQGGEPFAISSLKEVLEFVINEDKVKKVVIASNGTIIPYKCSELLKSNKVEVRISNYPVVAKGQISSLEKFLSSNHINYVFYDFSYNDSKWIDCGGLETTREEKDSMVSEIFDKCNFNHCLTLENGFIGKCSRCINASKVQGFKPQNGDLIDVRHNKNLRLSIQKYKIKCTPEEGFFMEACRYCHGTYYGKQVDPAIQLDSND